MTHHLTSFRCLLATCLLSSLAAQDVWFVGPSHTVGRTEPKPASSAVFDPAKKVVTLHAARNEFVSFQIVYSGDYKQVGIEPLILNNGNATLPQAEFFREHFMPCPVVSQYDGRSRPADVAAFNARYEQMKQVREFPSQLVPQGATKYGFPFDVAAGKNEAVWADLFIPEDAAPGVYTGTLSTAGSTFKVSLTVWNFTLPSVSHFPQFVYMAPEAIAWANGKSHRVLNKELKAEFDSYFQMAHNHRINLLEEWNTDPEYPKIRGYWGHQTGQGFKGPFAAGVGNELLQLGFEDGKLFPFAQIKEQGWEARSFVILLDEPGDKEAYDQVRANGAAVERLTGGQIRRVITEQAEPTKAEWGSLDPGVDIYCSGGTPISSIPALEAKGKVVWTYNAGYAGGPYIDAPAAACRTQAWAGFVTGSRAWYFWDGGYIVDKQFKWKKQRKEIYKAADPSPYVTNVWEIAMNFDETLRNNGTYRASDAIRLNGDGLLFYPGKEVGVAGAISCIRMKNLRQGSTDFEYLYLLEKAGASATALAEAKKLLGPTGSGVESKDGQQQKTARFDAYDATGDAWELARIRLGQQLDKIGDTKLRTMISPYNQYPNPTGHPSLYGGKRY